MALQEPCGLLLIPFFYPADNISVFPYNGIINASHIFSVYKQLPYA